MLKACLQTSDFKLERFSSRAAGPDTDCSAWCVSEFYAAHGTVTPAGITAIQNYLGSDAIDVTTTSTSLPGISRHYTSLNQIIADVNAARIYAGFHYRSTLVRSNPLGIAVANWVNDNMMTVLPESAVGPDEKDNER